MKQKKKQKGFPKIQPHYWDQSDPIIAQSQLDSIQTALCKILPEIFTDSISGEKIDERRKKFYEKIPVVCCSACEQLPGNLSFYLLSKYRANAFKFFFDMISSWLIPGYRLNVIRFYAADFTIPELDSEIYTFCEIMVRLDRAVELAEIKKNFPMIQKETVLGVVSSYYARRILEIKGLSADVKTALVHENISILIKRLPNDFDYDVFTEMQHVLMICPDSFKDVRSSRHLSRIISVQYLFRRSLFEAIKISPNKRHLKLKLFKSHLRRGDSEKNVLGIVVGINLLSDKEVFEERHVLKSVQNYLPDVHMIEGSFIVNRRGSEKLFTLYLEIEKSDGTYFTGAEIQQLRQELPNSLKDRIEHLMHPVFMPRNEEEVMRNIVSLANQINYLKDPPQVFISFDEQTNTKLYFTIIYVRVLKNEMKSLMEAFQGSDSFLEYIHDSVKTVGYIRRKNNYPKEATVFRVSLKKEMFLRGDHSIDLYKARQVVVQELERVLQLKFRDFNGGMISKQNELLRGLRNLVSEAGAYNELLLENFFYSITPPIMRSVLDPADLKTLYLLMVKAVEEKLASGKPFFISTFRDLDRLFILVAGEEPRMKVIVQRELSRFNITTTALGTIFVHSNDVPCLGFIYRDDDPYNQEIFCEKVKAAVEEAHVSLATTSQKI